MPNDSSQDSAFQESATGHVWSWTLKTAFPSRHSAHLKCLREILDELADIGWDGRDLFGIEMALEETLTNAIRHGNKLDESKQVQVECRVSPQRFWLRVEDEGCGFKPADVPDCRDEKNLEACGGRGLMLIRAYMTSVSYNEAGNCVTLEKIRSQPE